MQPKGAQGRDQRPGTQREVEDPVSQPIVLAGAHGQDAVGRAVDGDPSREHGDERHRGRPLRSLSGGARSVVGWGHES